MRKLFLALLFFYSQQLLANTDSLLLRHIDSLRISQEYDNILNLLNKRIKNDSNDIWSYYQSACYYALKGDSVNSTRRILQSIKLGQDSEAILTDTDFNSLHGTNLWTTVTSTLKKRYLTKHPKITLPILSVELWLLWIEDQRFRTLRKNYKLTLPEVGTIEGTALNEKLTEESTKRLKRIEQIINQYGWPTFSMVGEKSASAVFYIIQHSKTEYMKKYLPLMEQQVVKGEANVKLYVMMVDRLLMNKNKKQLYGTQFRSESKLVNGEWIKGETYLWYVEDEKNLNKRRLELGLTTIEEHAKKFGVTYKYIPENEKKSIRKIKKNLP